MADEAKSEAKVARDRLEVKLDHLSVATRDVVTQYPEAEAYSFDDNGNLVLLGDGGRYLAVIERSEWQAIYYPGTTRIMESFLPTYFDAEGNELPDGDWAG